MEIKFDPRFVGTDPIDLAQWKLAGLCRKCGGTIVTKNSVSKVCEDCRLIYFLDKNGNIR